MKVQILEVLLRRIIRQLACIYSERAVNKFLTPAMRPFLQQSTETMKTVEWSISSIEVTTRALIDELALKPREALLALRVAVSGGDVSPPLFLEHVSRWA